MRTTSWHGLVALSCALCVSCAEAPRRRRASRKPSSSRTATRRKARAPSNTTPPRPEVAERPATSRDEARTDAAPRQTDAPVPSKPDTPTSSPPTPAPRIAAARNKPRTVEARHAPEPPRRAAPGADEPDRRRSPGARSPAQLESRLPGGGFRDVTWLDPHRGRWATVDVTAHGIRPGAPDVTAELDALLEGLGTPTVLYFPPGTYRFGKISMRGSDVIIKGAGPKRTVFEPLVDGTVFELAGKGGWYDWKYLGKEYQPRAVTADVPPNGTVVPVADSSGLARGDTVMVVENLAKWTYSSAKRSRGGIFVVKSVAPRRITLDLPLVIGLDQVAKNRKDAFVCKLAPASNVGFEGFRVVMPEEKGAHGSIFHLKRTRNVYISNVESFNPNGHHVMIAYSRRVVVSGCFFDEAKVKGGGGNGYGVNLRDISTLCKIENNVFKDLRHHLGTETGANLSVYAYNFSVDRLRDLAHEKKSPQFRDQGWLNAKSANGITQGYVTADTVAHGNFPHHILLEGNVFYNGCVDTSHNVNGPHFFYRNKPLGQPPYYGHWQENCGIVIMGANDRQVVVGNYLANGSKTLLQKHDAARTSKDSLVGANVVNGAVEWGGLRKGTRLPWSLYLKDKPAFWPDTTEWPPYGPDVRNSPRNRIPAEVRYLRRIGVLKEDSPETKRAVIERPARRRPRDGAVEMMDKQLQGRLRTALTAGRKVSLFMSSVRQTMRVTRIDENAGLSLAARGGLNMTIAWPRLTTADKGALAAKLCTDGNEDDAFLAAFYALALRDKRAADEHLRNCPSRADDMKALFENAD